MNPFVRRSLRTAMLAFISVSVCLLPPAWAEEGRRQIEEVIVTAERKEASVSDTSISITAVTGEFIEDFGIRNQSDLQNLVPATTIQPYDSAVRGVGRNFRNLGGDPGVATYLNGVYSEDLYTATIGSFWDIERVEVLRGPQGTLYGRNAVGGAINFLYKKPEDEFDFSVKLLVGDFGQEELYGYITGPIVKDKLNARLTASSRRHDGWVEERGFGPDLDSGDERNFAVQLEWNISEKANLHLRSNRAIVDRVFGGADGGGLIVLRGESFDANDLTAGRDLTSPALGLRAVDTNNTDPANVLQNNFFDQSAELFEFTNPTTGETLFGQLARPGIDPTPDNGRVNHVATSAVQTDPNECVFSDRDNIEGDELCAFTNGLNSEIFNQNLNQLSFEYDINENVSFKYIAGFNQFLYERFTDDDSSASLVNDRQFFVTQEAEYFSHELQLFWDIGESLSFTSGIFFYDATIDQRADFFSSVGATQFTAPGTPGFLSTLAFGTQNQAINSASIVADNINAPEGTFVVSLGPFVGDESFGPIDRAAGPTPGTDLQYDTTTIRDSFAAYTQGVWDINEKFSLTFGLRYARDDLEGQENLLRYSESEAAAIGVTTQMNDAGEVVSVGSLTALNTLIGALDPSTGQLTGAVNPVFSGLPLTFGAFRELERRDEDITWRVNLDYNVTDDSLIYANVTTGYRGGGFNLVFFSQTPEFDPEELTAFEIGYKAQLADGTLQLNASAYLYDYDSIHTRTEEACPPDQTLQSAQSACAVTENTTSIQAAPGAEVLGAELEWLWLATNNLTFGGNVSYTRSEYDEDFFVVDGADPRFPNAIYTAETNPDRAININGNQLLQVPQVKANAYVNYKVPLGDAGALDFIVNWSYIDEVFFSAFEAELDRAPSYQRWDFRSTWRSASSKWAVSAFVNNVLDEIGIRQIIRNNQVEGFRRTAQVTEPRHLGVEFSYTLK